MKTSQVEDAPEPDIELLESHRCSKVLVCLGDDDINDKLLRETHPEESELVHLCDVLTTMRVELAFGVGDVGYPPGAHSGLFEPLIPRVHCGGFSVFRCWFVVVVDFNSLAPEFVDGVSPFTYVWNNITTSNLERIDFTGHSSSWFIAFSLTRTGSTVKLTRKWQFTMWNSLPSSMSGMRMM